MKSIKLISNLMYIILLLSIFSVININPTSGYLIDRIDSSNSSENSIQLQGSPRSIILINSTYPSINSTSGTGVEEDPYVYKGLNLTGDRSKDLITINGTNAYYLIIDGVFTEGYNGIVVINATNVNITNNLIFKNSEYGISFTDSWNNTVKNNTINDNGEGNGCTEPNLTINQYRLNSHMGGGIHFDPSGNSTVEGNEIFRNYVAGIILEQAENVTIIGNNIYENGWKNCTTFANQDLSLSQPSHLTGYGILIQSSVESVIKYNQIQKNTKEGIMILSGGISNEISTNNFINNGKGDQAADYGSENTFSCNFWGTDDTNPYTFTSNSDQTPYNKPHNIMPPFSQQNPCEVGTNNKNTNFPFLYFLGAFTMVIIISRKKSN